MIGADSSPGQGGASFDLSFAAAMLAKGAQNLNQGFFPPSNPLVPLAPADAGWGRAFDYNPSFNLQNVPHGNESFTYQQLRDLARVCDYINICEQTVVDRVCGVSGGVYDIGGDPKKPNAKAVQISRWMDRPDGINSFYDWFSPIFRDQIEIDAPAVWIDRRGSTPLARYVDGATIAVRINEQGSPYLLTQIIKGAPAHDYDLNTMIWLPKNRRTWTPWGFSPVEQIAHIVSLALHRIERQSAFFTDGDIPSMLIEAPQNWTPDQIKAMNFSWSQMLSGISGKDKARWMPPGSKATVYDRDPSKGEFDEWLIRVICYCFSLPPTAFVRETNRATAGITQEASIAEGHKANLRWSAGFLTSVITAAWGPGFEWRWNLDEDPTSATIIALLTAGALKPSVCARLGFTPEEIADAMPAQAAADAAAEAAKVAAAKPPEDKAPPKSDAKGGKPGDQENGHVHVPILNGESLNASPEFTQFLTGYLDDLRAEAVKNGTKAYKTGAEFTLNDDPGFVMRAVPYLREAYRGGVDKGVSVVAGGPGPAAVPDSEALTFARERAAWLVGRKWVDGELVDNPDAKYAISQVARDEIRASVSRGLEEHWTAGQLSEAISEAQGFTPARALNIARTETANAQGSGKLDYFLEAGITHKEWSDFDGCPDCKANAEQGVIPVEDEFQSGDMHEPAHPNCVCTVMPA